MSVSERLLEAIEPVVSLMPHKQLQEVLRSSFHGEQEAIHTIENCFARIPQARWSHGLLCTVLSSWKATHLKMLAIYGLSCRLQRMATDLHGNDKGHSLHLAAARNAETSYEDLGLDFDAQTHAELYEQFAAALVGDDSWQLQKYCLTDARAFGRWVYRNMIVEDVQKGLLTNMFSEIYNHGEYSIALPAFDRYMLKHSDLTAEQREGALTYIRAHVVDETEADHFRVVVEALEHYWQATGRGFDHNQAERVFRTYLQRLALVMHCLSARMAAETSSRRGTSQSLRAG